MRQPFTPYHQFAYSPYCSLNIFLSTDEENLLENQELSKLVIISLILMALMFDAGVIM